MERIEFDFSKLIGRIVERFGTRTAFATAAGFTDPMLSSRLNNKTPWGCDEIVHVSQPDLLDIQPMEYGVYFFTPKVR